MLSAGDLETLKRQLTASEGRKYVLYDDATGQRITKGSTVIGHPTWGVGFNCDEEDFTDEAIDAQFEIALNQRVHDVNKALPWTSNLPAPQLRAVLDIAYNAGVDGLLKFHKMLAAVQQGQYVTAATEIERSQLAPARRQRLAVLMRTLT